MTAKELYKIFDERKWIDDTIDVVNPEDTGKKNSIEDDVMVDESIGLQYEEAKKRIQELEHQVKLLQEQITTKQTKIPFKPNNAAQNEIRPLLFGQFGIDTPVSNEELFEFLDLLGED